jgi:hypothetical protein
MSNLLQQTLEMDYLCAACLKRVDLTCGMEVLSTEPASIIVG